MPRIKQIDFRRITISLPAALVDRLKMATVKGDMSSYISSAIDEKLSSKHGEKETNEELISSLKKLAIENKSQSKTQKGSLELLREIRYNGKY